VLEKIVMDTLAIPPAIIAQAASIAHKQEGEEVSREA